MHDQEIDVHLLLLITIDNRDNYCITLTIMSFVIKSKNLKLDKKIEKDLKKSIGDYYSDDRFYTLLNEYIDINLNNKSRILCFIIKYLFKSSNYKHDTSIANGKSIGCTLLDLFCILCIIGFIAMVISVMGLSFAGINSAAGISNFVESFMNNIFKNIVMLVFALIFLVIAILWLIMFFKIRKKNAKLSLKDYVTRKINFVLKCRFFIKSYAKAVEKTTQSMKINKKEVKVFCLAKFEQQGSNTNRWVNLQTINLLASIFVDFNLVFKFNSLTEDEYKELKEVIEYDFKRIELLEYKD